MTFAGQTDKPTAAAMIASFVANNKLETRGAVELDSARMYEGGNTEKLLGEVLSANSELRAKTTVATKFNAFPTHNKSLAPDAIAAQMAGALADLQADSVGILYLHAPDANSPIEPTLEAVAALHAAGKFAELGLSNYSAWEVAYIHGYMAAKGHVLPTVYQGMYNLLTRAIETELLPCLRKLGMRCYVYNPLAGGMLTGKHSFDAMATEGRFAGNTMYQDRFWRKSFFDALDVVKAACGVEGVLVATAALRWVRHHSALRAACGDGLIIGASKVGHFEANLAAAQEGPLSDAIVAAMDAAWEQSKGDCPGYFRGQSKVE